MSLFPPFHFETVFVLPWTSQFGSFGWVMLMGFLVTASCGMIGNFMVLRRMSLMGDAISHSILPGLAVAFLLSGSRSTWVMLLGAIGAGIMTSMMIEMIHRNTRVKQDAAIGITFSFLFAVGVLLVTGFADHIDLDADCVLYGEIAFVPLAPPVMMGVLEMPESVARMLAVFVLTCAGIVFFYRQLLVSSFDPGISISLGLNNAAIHYAITLALSVIVVSAFEAVGAILVIAMIIIPGCQARLLSDKLPVMIGWTFVHSAVSAVLGTHLGIWLDCSIGAAMVIVSFAQFLLTWWLHPRNGLLGKWMESGGMVTEVSS